MTLSVPQRLAAASTILMLAGVALPAVSFFNDPESYLSFHIVLELIAVMTSAMVATLAWYQRGADKNNHLAIVCGGFFAVVAIDVAHTLSFNGMPALLTPSSSEKAINFWLAGRLIAVLVLISLALIRETKWGRRQFVGFLWLSALATSVFCWVGLQHPAWFPRTFIEGTGLTAFKVGAEYVLMVLYGVAAYLLYRRAVAENRDDLAWLACGSWILGLAEAFFTLYGNVTDIFNLLGHVFKAFGYMLIFHAIYLPSELLVDKHGGHLANKRSGNLATLSFGLTSLILVVSISGFLLSQSRAQLTAKAEGVAENLAIIASQFSMTAIHEPEVLLQLAAQQYQEQKSKNTFQVSSFLTATERMASRVPSIDNLRLSDRDGIVRYLASGPLSPAVDITDRSYFVLAKGGEKNLIVSTPIEGKVSKKWVLPLALRLLDAKSRFDGVLNANVRVDYFSELLANFPQGKGSTLQLFGEDTTIYFRYSQANPVANLTGSKIRNSDFLALWDQGIREANYTGTSNIDGVRRFYSYRKVGDYPLYVMVGLSEDEVLSEWRTDVGVITAFSIIMGILISLLVASHRNSLVEATRQELRLRDERRRLDDILTGTNVGTWEWNVQTGGVVFNERWATMIGYTLRELEPVDINTWVNFCHPEDLERSNNLLQRHFAGELPFYEFEGRMKHKDGHWIWVLDRGKVASWSEDGKPLIMSGTHQDITDRKQAESALKAHKDELEMAVAVRTADLEVAKDAAEAANRAKTTFLSVASHELRTPLNGIMGTIALAKKRANDPKQLDYLDKANRASHQLLSIINDVLDISRIESDRLTLARDRFGLSEIRTRLLDAVSSIAHSKNLPLSYPEDALLERQAYLGDPVRLSQILINLVGNALKFTEAGEVSVSVKDTNQDSGGKRRIRFEVRDTGIGIAQEDHSRIFAPFEQGDSSHTRRFGGTGLGLALCKKLVEAMHGQIGLESQLGHGSLFWFEVLLEPTESSLVIDATPTDYDESIKSQYRGATLLLVDDESLNLEIARAILEEIGFNILTASDGIEALEVAKANQPDLILMDVKMPRMDGITATREIRQIPSLAETPILAITANAFSQDRDDCFNAGMSDYISKPFVPGEMLKKVLAWLAKSKAS